MKKLIKPLISIVILTLLISMTDTSTLLQTFTHIPLWVLFTVIFGYCIGQVISAFKWFLIARSGDIDVPFLSALKAYFIGMFVNCFGLGLIGGDLARALLLTKGSSGKGVALASVAADRIHGLTVLSGLGSLVLLFSNVEEVDPFLKIFLPALFFCLLSAWFIGPFILEKVLPEGNRFRDKCLSMLRVFPRSPKKILAISSLSVLFHCLQIGLHWVMGLGVNESVSLALLFTVIPLVAILTSLPISWNGLGVREYAYQAFLTPEPLDLDQAIAFGAMWLLATTVASALGGILGAFGHDLKKVKELARTENSNTDDSEVPQKEPGGTLHSESGKRDVERGKLRSSPLS